MDKDKLNELWAQVEHIGKIEHLSYDAMLAFGSIFGQMSSEIEFLNEKLEKLEVNDERDHVRS